MNISKINFNQSFGKQEVMTCKVKESQQNSSKNATLYKLNPEDVNDQKDVYYSKQTICIADDFEKAPFDSFASKKDFYILTDDKSGEVISCAETSHRYRPSELPYSGQYTLIEEAKENNKYKNGLEPLFAYITKLASNNDDRFIFTAFDEETVEGLKNSKFSQIKTGEYYISQENFNPLIDNAEKQFKMEYFI